MRQTIIVSALTAAVTVVLSVVILNQLGAGTVSSASSGIAVSDSLPSSEDGQVQGDTDCDGDVDAVDGLGVLVNVAAIEALVQQEPCTDIANLIPAGEGVPGPQGPAGPQGAAGPQGPAGVTDIELVNKVYPADGFSIKFANAECPDSKKVLGGGIANPSGYASVAPLDNRPHDDLGGWFGQVHVADVSNPPPFDWGITVYAICANVAE